MVLNRYMYGFRVYQYLRRLGSELPHLFICALQRFALRHGKLFVVRFIIENRRVSQTRDFGQKVAVAFPIQDVKQDKSLSSRLIFFWAFHPGR